MVTIGLDVGTNVRTARSNLAKQQTSSEISVTVSYRSLVEKAGKETSQEEMKQREYH